MEEISKEESERKEKAARIFRVISLVIIILACVCLLISIELLIKHSQEIIQASKLDPCGLCFKLPGNSSFEIPRFQGNSSISSIIG